MILTKRLVALLSVFSVALAAKDSDYYPPGMTNPNVKQEMYWKDAVNVLQDLDQFESLHILYHGCVYVFLISQQSYAFALHVPGSLGAQLLSLRWSLYGPRYGTGESYEYNQNGGGGGGESNGCGGDGGEYFWYMGRTQCFRANVAFSLYGILEGQSHSGKACQKSTYINSFFTTYGVESFGGPLGLGVDTANSYCTTQEAAEDQDKYYDAGKIDDDYLSDNVQFINYMAYTSIGTGCAAGKFVTDKYTGAFCHGDLYQETVDTLDSFNAAIESLGCTQIYSSSSRRELQEYQKYDFAEMDAVKILSCSTVCDIRQYPKDCPDPYGKKMEYTKNLERALSQTSITTASHNPMQIVTYVFAGLFAVAGLLFVAAAYNVRRKAVRKPQDSADGVFRVSNSPTRRVPSGRAVAATPLPKSSTPPPKSSTPPPVLSSDSVTSADSSEFWTVPTSLSQVASKLKAKIETYTESGPQSEEPTPPRNATAAQTSEPTVPSTEFIEGTSEPATKKTRLAAFTRRLFGKKH